MPTACPSRPKSKPAFFRSRKLKEGQILITNDFGHFAMLTDAEYRQYLSGTPPDSPMFGELRQKGFLRDFVDFEDLIARYRSRNSFLRHGPSLHIVVVTLRCNHKCLYCHASAGGADNRALDMSRDVARKVVDTIFETTSPAVTLEFQGGEPLLNWEAVRFIIEYAQSRGKFSGKKFGISLVSNFSLMDQEKFDYLVGKQVSLCTSLDGPEKIHNQNRLYLEGNSQERTVHWLRKIKASYDQGLYPFRPAALTTVTKATLPYPKEIVDACMAAGLSSIYLRSLNPFGLARKTWDKIGYTPEEYLQFYKKAIDYVIELNMQGKRIRELLAVTFLTKMLTDKDPCHMDYRSPGAAGIGVLAYNYNGGIYTSDEGRMLGRMGDDTFKIGDVLEDSYEDLMKSDVVKSACFASCLDALPGCGQCTYKSYCGVSVEYNYIQQGSIFGQMPTNGRCKISKATFDYLFDRLQHKDVEQIFLSWIGLQ